jgi:superoxide dismutase, Fe-Mn family
MSYKLPDLPYSFDALEPHIDAQTMQIHHDKHHGAYVAGLNRAIEGRDLGNLKDMTVEQLLAVIDTLPVDIRNAVQNYGGGHANHSLFWTILSGKGGGTPRGDLAEAIDEQFGNFGRFTDEVTKAALGRFGSGWAWLSLNPNRRLVIETTPNQDSPWMHGNIPVFGIDVWEHAYYLKYQNRRADYLTAIWNVVNWDAVTERYLDAVRYEELIKSP